MDVRVSVKFAVHFLNWMRFRDILEGYTDQFSGLIHLWICIIYLVVYCPVTKSRELLGGFVLEVKRRLLIISCCV